MSKVTIGLASNPKFFTVEHDDTRSKVELVGHGSNETLFSNAIFYCVEQLNIDISEVIVNIYHNQKHNAKLTARSIAKFWHCINSDDINGSFSIAFQKASVPVKPTVTYAKNYVVGRCVDITINSQFVDFDTSGTFDIVKVSSSDYGIIVKDKDKPSKEHKGYTKPIIQEPVPQPAIIPQDISEIVEKIVQEKNMYLEQKIEQMQRQIEELTREIKQLKDIRAVQEEIPANPKENLMDIESGVKSITENEVATVDISEQFFEKAIPRVFDIEMTRRNDSFKFKVHALVSNEDRICLVKYDIETRVPYSNSDHYYSNLKQGVLGNAVIDRIFERCQKYEHNNSVYIRYDDIEKIVESDSLYSINFSKVKVVA